MHYKIWKMMPSNFGIMRRSLFTGQSDGIVSFSNFIRHMPSFLPRELGLIEETATKTSLSNGLFLVSKYHRRNTLCTYQCWIDPPVQYYDGSGTAVLSHRCHKIPHWLAIYCLLESTSKYKERRSCKVPLSSSIFTKQDKNSLNRNFMKQMHYRNFRLK